MPFTESLTEGRVHSRQKVNGLDRILHPSSSTGSSPMNLPDIDDWNLKDDHAQSDNSDIVFRGDPAWLRTGSKSLRRDTPSTLPRAAARAASAGIPMSFEQSLAISEHLVEKQLKDEAEARKRRTELNKYSVFSKNAHTVFEATDHSRNYHRFLPTSSPQFPVALWKLMENMELDKLIDKGEKQPEKLLAKVKAGAKSARAAPSTLTERKSPSEKTASGDVAADTPADAVAKKKKKPKKKKKKKSTSALVATPEKPLQGDVNGARVKTPVSIHGTQESVDLSAAAAAEPTASGPFPERNFSNRRSSLVGQEARKEIGMVEARRGSLGGKEKSILPAALKPTARVESTPPPAHADLESDIHNITISPMVPSALYGPLLEEILGYGYALEGISRKSEYFANQERLYKNGIWKPTDWREDLKTVTSFSFSLQLSKKPEGLPLTAGRCLDGLRSFLLKAVESPGLTKDERDALQKATADDLFRVYRDVKTKGTPMTPDTTERRLPFKEKAEARIARADIFYADPELPQVVFIAARLSFATPIMKKLLEATNRFELLGIKYLKDLSVAHAKYLTPYEVGDAKWAASLEKITEQSADLQGWVMIVVRKTNGLERVDEIVGAYLHSYLSISDSADSRPPSLGRRRRGQKANDTPATSASELFTPFEALRLNVLVSPNVEACYQQITTFFRDSELVPAGTQGWEDREFHPPWFLHNPYIGKTLMDHALFLSTVCVVKAALFPIMGKIISRIYQEDFAIVGLKVTRVQYNAARKLFANEADIARFGADAIDRFYSELTEGPVAIFLLQRTNAIKKWLDVMADIRQLSGTAKSAGSLFEGGMYASQTYNQARVHQSALFPEGPTLRLRYSRNRSKFEKFLYPTEAITEVPKSPRTLICNRRRESYFAFAEQQRELIRPLSVISSRSSMASPPPTPVSEAETLDPPELVCATLLPAHLETEETYRSWGAILDALLLETKKESEGSEEGCKAGSSDSGSVQPVESDRLKRGAGKRRKKQQKKEKERVIADDSSVTNPDSTPDLPPPRLVACRYVVCGESAVAEWQKYAPDDERQGLEPTGVLQSWSARLRDEHGTTIISDDAPPSQLMQRGACLALALEVDHAERVKAIIDSLPESQRRCITFTTTCEQACGQLPLFFGDLYDSFYRIALERHGHSGVAG